jgi:hypothetical protein
VGLCRRVVSRGGRVAKPKVDVDVADAASGAVWHSDRSNPRAGAG